MDRCDQPDLRTMFESAPGLDDETEDQQARTSGRQNRPAERPSTITVPEKVADSNLDWSRSALVPAS